MRSSGSSAETSGMTHSAGGLGGLNPHRRWVNRTEEPDFLGVFAPSVLEHFFRRNDIADRLRVLYRIRDDGLPPEERHSR